MVLPMTASSGAGGAPGARQLACPVKMTGFEFAVRHPAPRQGEHTNEVLQRAGYSLEEVQALRHQGAVG